MAEGRYSVFCQHSVIREDMETEVTHSDMIFGTDHLAHALINTSGNKWHLSSHSFPEEQ